MLVAPLSKSHCRHIENTFAKHLSKIWLIICRTKFVIENFPVCMEPIDSLCKRFALKCQEGNLKFQLTGVLMWTGSHGYININVLKILKEIATVR